MTAPTTTTSLIARLQQINTPTGRCRTGTVLDDISPAERAAVDEAFAAKVDAGRGGPSWSALAKILSDETGSKLTDDDLRHHAKGECRCE